MGSEDTTSDWLAFIALGLAALITLAMPLYQRSIQPVCQIDRPVITLTPKAEAPGPADGEVDPRLREMLQDMLNHD